MMRKKLLYCLFFLLFASCSIPGFPGTNPGLSDEAIPEFDHVVWVVLENRSFDEVIGSAEMPYLNQLASKNVLLDQFYAVRHPSLPNYIALIGGSTFGIDSDCTDCFVNQTSLPDLLEAAGRTWKTYQEDMPSACFLGNQGQYAQKHNPFVYFDPIRLDTVRCQRSVVPLPELERDLAENHLPDFAFISPNLCHSGHDCSLGKVDEWLKQVIEPLRNSTALGDNSMIVITYDEAKRKDTESCCGLGWRAGGRVAAVLISPLAKQGFKDSTPHSHYSLLKTILIAWQLPDLGATKDPANAPITTPWK